MDATICYVDGVAEQACDIRRDELAFSRQADELPGACTF